MKGELQKPIRGGLGWTCRECNHTVAGPYNKCSNCGFNPSRPGQKAHTQAPKGEPMPIVTTKPVEVSNSKETSEEKFVRLANEWVPKALARIRRLGNLSNYKGNEAQFKKIEYELIKEVDKVMVRIRGKHAETEEFKL